MFLQVCLFLMCVHIILADSVHFQPLANQVTDSLSVCSCCWVFQVMMQAVTASLSQTLSPTGWMKASERTTTPCTAAAVLTDVGPHSQMMFLHTWLPSVSKHQSALNTSELDICRASLAIFWLRALRGNNWEMSQQIKRATKTLFCFINVFFFCLVCVFIWLTEI